MAATAVATASPALITTSAHAATKGTLPASLAVCAHCPVDTAGVTACVWASAGGTFTFGTAVVTLPSPAILNLGFISNSDGTITVVAPTDKTPILAAPAAPVPGGLLGIGTSPGTGILGVTATAVTTAVPTASLSNLLGATGTAISLPLAVELTNPLLGSNCTLGTAAAPITLNLTTGTTAPPSPGKPETGSKGTIAILAKGVTKITGVSLVDNTFAVPGASNCGPGGLFNGIVNAEKKLPSAAGLNNAVLPSTVETAPAALIKKYIG